MHEKSTERRMEKIYKFGKIKFREEKENKMKPVCLAVLAVAFFISISAFVSAYQPPMYIANPETKDCQYYFAGESDCFDACMNDCQGAGLNYTNCLEPCANQYCHYNLKPKGFTVDIGKTADFASINESCRVWQDCVNSGGEWNGTTAKCLPKAEEKAKSSDTLAITSITISIMALVAIIIIYLKIRKMMRQMHAEKK